MSVKLIYYEWLLYVELLEMGKYYEIFVEQRR